VSPFRRRRRASPPERTAPQLLTDPTWQMSWGERAALEGLLAGLRPRLAIEIGTAEGGSLKRIAAHSGEVHSFDLVDPAPDVAALGNVRFHRGDSHELLPALLAELERAGRNVDFVLVDGDHSADGVRRDLEDLLRSGAARDTAILIHDTTNDEVRRGLDAVPYEELTSVVHVDLDFVPGYLAREEPFRHQLWGGLGLVLVDAARPREAGAPVRQGRFYPAFELFRAARDAVLAGERADGTA
jgi:hypothetical protein